jgi:hypothetical protein
MTHTDIPRAANILAIYGEASADTVRFGLQWYYIAHNAALSMGGGRAWHLSRNAGIIAALSPLNEWNNNIRKAREVVSKRGRITVAKGQPNGIGLGNNVAKAVAIYNGAEPLSVLGGDKVRAFYQTILDPSSTEISPVIDRHAFDIAVGERTDEKRRGALSRKGVYEQFAVEYRAAAITAGIGASQMQAITWVAWKEKYNIAI